jgi:acyl-CoA reductase-like NAD-dependent aldehyde dehydrogenase
MVGAPALSISSNAGPRCAGYHTFGGQKRSGFGDINQHGTEGVRFWGQDVRKDRHFGRFFGDAP